MQFDNKNRKAHHELFLARTHTHTHTHTHTPQCQTHLISALTGPAAQYTGSNRDWRSDFSCSSNVRGNMELVCACVCVCVCVSVCVCVRGQDVMPMPPHSASCLNVWGGAWTLCSGLSARKMDSEMQHALRGERVTWPRTHQSQPW